MKKFIKRLFWHLAKRFIAGSSMSRALKTARKCNRRYLGASIDVLGEECRTREDTQKAFEKYKKLIVAIFNRHVGGSLKNTGISIKLSHFGLRFNKIYCEETVREIVRSANARSIFVWIDMESKLYFRHILDIAVKLRQDYPNVGVAFQAYRRDALRMLPSLIESRIAVRLCKGAYRESAVIIFKKKSEIRKNFMLIAEEILKTGKNHLAVATHDKFLINQCQILAKNLKIPAAELEFQMLLGIEYELHWLRNLGFQATVYVPFGKNWFPYILRRLYEKPLKTLFMLIQSFSRNNGRKKEKGFLAKLFSHEHHHH